MRRRSFVRALACLGLLAACGLVAVGYLVRRVPREYDEIPVPEGPERVELSAEFSKKVQGLLDKIGNADDVWKEEFTAEQVNSYFTEDFVRVRPFKLPEGVHSPRVAIKPGRLRLAFRLGRDFWSSVVTVDVNVWLVANEANVVAVEVLGVRAGAVPVALQSMMERVAEGARPWNLEVTWYRREGNPVALVRFQPDRANPPVVLQRLELQDGKLVVEGKSSEPAPLRAMLSMHGIHAGPAGE